MRAATCHADIAAAIDPLRVGPAIEIRSGVAGAPASDRPQIHDGIVRAGGDRESCIRCHTTWAIWCADAREAARGIGMSKPRWILFAAIAAAVVTLVVAAVLTTIVERKQEARNPFYRVVELTDHDGGPRGGGQTSPSSTTATGRTVDHGPHRYGGSEATPRTPTAIDPRTGRGPEHGSRRTRGSWEMWAGYAFAHDFREERGHAYMLDDQVFTERQRAATAARHLPPLPRLDVRAPTCARAAAT